MDAVADCARLNNVIHTVGHSTRAAQPLIELLALHRVALLVDVRRWPVSRRLPHFCRETLAELLGRAGIDYRWRGDLGGFRKPAPGSPNTGWKTAAFRGYADFALTEEFAAGVEEIAGLAKERPTALMCAEALPWRCHRQLLADAFVVRGWRVRHILDDGCREHRLPPFARPEGTRIFYPAAAATPGGEPLTLWREEK
ncbi:MAG TPA: DUF488 domain-containing protein [candidate division Zixibacteria bacterium]|nr:DUF488 domain-containing protein [candidate division Zixibacteria bacterium]